MQWFHLIIEAIFNLFIYINLRLFWAMSFYRGLTFLFMPHAPLLLCPCVHFENYSFNLKVINYKPPMWYASSWNTFCPCKTQKKAMCTWRAERHCYLVVDKGDLYKPNKNEIVQKWLKTFQYIKKRTLHLLFARKSGTNQSKLLVNTWLQDHICLVQFLYY